MNVEFYASPTSGTANYFYFKHLYILPEATSVSTMITEGRKVFDGRLKARRDNKKKNKAKRNTDETAKYGAGYDKKNADPSSTLIVLSLGGFEGLKAAIIKNGGASGWYDILNGVIFQATSGGHEEGNGKVHLGIRKKASTYEVYHLEDALITVKLNVSSNAASQLHLTSFRTTPEALQAAKQKLSISPPGFTVRELDWDFGSM